MQGKGNFLSLVKTPSSLTLVPHRSDAAAFILHRCSCGLCLLLKCKLLTHLEQPWSIA